MEGYSIFSPSTNSSSSSRSSPSRSSNFPFSLTRVSSTTSNNSLNHMDHHDYHDLYHADNQSEPLMLMGEQHLIQPPMIVQSTNQLMNNYYQDDNNINHHQVNNNNNNNDDVNGSKVIKKGLLEKKVKKHRYAFQTRSHVDILDDGYRWRKYGQKAVKNNKFPRSYYRCTHQGCNVKKQVQRLSNDEGVVITTYEGIHSHTIERSTDNFEHILSQMQIYTTV